jgi:hypothetical protein
LFYSGNADVNLAAKIFLEGGMVVRWGLAKRSVAMLTVVVLALLLLGLVWGGVAFAAVLVLGLLGVLAGHGLAYAFRGLRAVRRSAILTIFLWIAVPAGFIVVGGILGNGHPPTGLEEAAWQFGLGFLLGFSVASFGRLAQMEIKGAEARRKARGRRGGSGLSSRQGG